MAVFSPIFVTDTKILVRCDFVAPLTFVDEGARVLVFTSGSTSQNVEFHTHRSYMKKVN